MELFLEGERSSLADLDDATSILVIEQGIQEIDVLLEDARAITDVGEELSNRVAGLQIIRGDLEDQLGNLITRTDPAQGGSRVYHHLPSTPVQPTPTLTAETVDGQVLETNSATHFKELVGLVGLEAALGRAVAEIDANADEGPDTWLGRRRINKYNPGTGIEARNGESSSGRPVIIPQSDRSRLAYNVGNASSEAARQPIPAAQHQIEPIDTPDFSEITLRDPIMNEKHQCVICMDELPFYYLCGLLCSHECCSSCLTEMFRGATMDESRYPPRCCAPISLETAGPFLNWKVLRNFEEKKVEWESKNRTYCSNAECGAFIRERDIYLSLASCVRCYRVTCINCKKVAHGDRPCPDDEDVQRTLELMEREGWRRCDHCRNGVERIDGCNHMTCQCGFEFCYACGMRWKHCDCPTYPPAPVPPTIPPAAIGGRVTYQCVAHLPALEQEAQEWARRGLEAEGVLRQQAIRELAASWRRRGRVQDGRPQQ